MSDARATPAAASSTMRAGGASAFRPLASASPPLRAPLNSPCESETPPPPTIHHTPDEDDGDRKDSKRMPLFTVIATIPSSVASAVTGSATAAAPASAAPLPATGSTSNTNTSDRETAPHAQNIDSTPVQPPSRPPIQPVFSSSSTPPSISRTSTSTAGPMTNLPSAALSASASATAPRATHRPHAHSMSERTHAIAQAVSATNSGQASPSMNSSHLHSSSSSRRLASGANSPALKTSTRGVTQPAGSHIGSTTQADRSSPGPPPSSWISCVSSPVSAPLLAYPSGFCLPVMSSPPQFSLVDGRLYRCGRFGEAHFAFLETLQLRTIVDLSSDDRSGRLSGVSRAWAAERGIDVINAADDDEETDGTDEANGSTLDGDGAGVFDSTSLAISRFSDLVKSALDLSLLASRAPLLLVCRDGIDLCSLVVGCLRRMQGWSFTSVVEELSRFRSSQRLREEVRPAADHGGHKEDDERDALHSAQAVRYAHSKADEDETDESTFRIEQMVELFDLELVTVPDDDRMRGRRQTQAMTPPQTSRTAPDEPKRKDTAGRGDATPNAPASSSSRGRTAPAQPPICVDWFLAGRRAEQRELRQLRREQRRQRRACREKADAAAASDELAPATAGLPADGEPAAPAATRPSSSLAAGGVSVASSWPASLFAQSALVSSGVRFDRKATLVDDDED